MFGPSCALLNWLRICSMYKEKQWNRLCPNRKLARLPYLLICVYSKAASRPNAPYHPRHTWLTLWDEPFHTCPCPYNDLITFEVKSNQNNSNIYLAVFLFAQHKGPFSEFFLSRWFVLAIVEIKCNKRSYECNVCVCLFARTTYCSHILSRVLEMLNFFLNICLELVEIFWKAMIFFDILRIIKSLKVEILRN